MSIFAAGSSKGPATAMVARASIQVYVRGWLRPALDGGNGLFRAVPMSLNQTETVSPEQIADLRNRAATGNQADRQRY